MRWKVTLGAILLCQLTAFTSTLQALGERERVAIAAKTIQRYGWKYYVCYRSLRGNSDYVCVSVGELSKVFESRALEIARLVREEAEKFAKENSAVSNANQFLDAFGNQQIFSGCAGSPKRRGAAYLTKKPLQRPQSRSPRTTPATLDSRILNICNQPTPRTTSISTAIGILYDNEMDIVEFHESTQKYRTRCKDEWVGQPPPAVDWIGRIWALFTRDRWRQPSGVSNGGIRGYCDPEITNCNSYCETAARVAAYVDLLIQYEYDGCNAQVTPNPQNPDTCYNLRTGQQVLSGKQMRELQEQWCAARGGIMGGTRQVPKCDFPAVSPASRNTNICQDPRAMCTDDQAPVVPRTGFTYTKDFPRPPNPVDPMTVLAGAPIN